jgi:PilZ domain
VVEQRRSKRFELKLPVELVRAGSSLIRKAGETHNLSSCGVLMTTGARLPVGESIEYMITLPVLAEGDQAVRLRCMGKVVRHDVAASAATLERYEFVRS